MSDIETGAILLQKAKNDAAALRAMLGNDAFTGDIYGFHAQQAVEKALKAWVCTLGQIHPKIHDLEALFQILIDAGVDVPPQFRVLEHLTDFGVQYRYAAFTDLGQDLDRAETLRQVEELLDYVEDVLRRSLGS